MKSYKLIKKYPGSPKLGYIANSSIIPSEIKFTKKQVENYPEFWEEIVEKDYDILYRRNNTHNDMLPIRFWDIHSIKRLSDGEIFTIGDKLETGIIKEFYLPSGPQKEVTIYVTKDDEDTYLSEARHIKQPLFTTEDGVDIYDRSHNLFEVILSTFHLNCNIPLLACNDEFDKRKDGYASKVFSTKEAADDYILLNKPCLSVNDLSNLLTKVNKKLVYDKQWVKALEQLVKSKL